MPDTNAEHDFLVGGSIREFLPQPPNTLTFAIAPQSYSFRSAVADTPLMCRSRSIRKPLTCGLCGRGSIEPMRGRSLI